MTVAFASCWWRRSENDDAPAHLCFADLPGHLLPLRRDGSRNFYAGPLADSPADARRQATRCSTLRLSAGYGEFPLDNSGWKHPRRLRSALDYRRGPDQQNSPRARILARILNCGFSVLCLLRSAPKNAFPDLSESALPADVGAVSDSSSAARASCRNY